VTEGEGVSEEETMKGRTSEKEVEKSKSLKENKGLGFFIFDVRFGKRTSHNGLDEKKMRKLHILKRTSRHHYCKWKHSNALSENCHPPTLSTSSPNHHCSKPARPHIQTISKASTLHKTHTQ